MVFKNPLDILVKDARWQQIPRSELITLSRSSEGEVQGGGS